MNKLALMIVIILTSFDLYGEDIRSYPLGEWPLLAKFTQSECLDIDNDLLDLPITARAEKTSIFSRFILSSFGGKVYVNPQVNKGWRSITFSLETASNQVGESGLTCFQVFDVGLKAWPEKYTTLYILVDKTVRYEIPIDKTQINNVGLN